LIQTPKNIGGAHNQFLFYAGGISTGAPAVKTLRRVDGEWASLVEEVKQWLT
jgi:hypothetical protein